MNNEKILVTAALPYANGPIHLGHLSGAYLPADIYVRYQRLKGREVLFVCGSDEHGVPITITADKEGVPPKVIIDRFHEINKESFEKFNMSFDIYSRTSIPQHHETASKFFLEYYNQGLLVEKKSEQFFDEKKKMFLPDRYVEGTCPKCGYEAARSDECEKCGSLYEPLELINPVSKISGTRPVMKSTSHWYFPLDKFQKRLEEYVGAMDEKYGWKDNVLQYCRGWFKDGLRERAYTRDLDWGVQAPIEGNENKVLYVWFEAVLGYISATIQLSEQREDEDLWRRYWQDESTKYVAFIGKDNVVFHCIIFPAMLMAWNDKHKEKYILPQNVPANEFLNFEGEKFSKSKNWGIDAIDFLHLFPSDLLRYTLAANMPENRDTDFYWNEFQARTNNELADILGNFVNRTFTFAHKQFDGKIPSLYELNERDSAMLNLLESYPAKISVLFEKYKLKDGTLEIMNLARAANKYFNDSEPWKTIKSNEEQCSTTINICLQTIYTLAELFSPIIPDTAEKMFSMLDAKPTGWDNCGNINLTEGQTLNEPLLLFQKIEDEVIEKQKLNLGKRQGESADVEKEEFEEIEIDDFMKVQLRTATIIEAENIKKSKKLLKLQVDLGFEKRQVIAGIARHYKPEEIIGKKIIVVANLKPAKLMGRESQGMILALENRDGTLRLLEADDEVENGIRAK